MERVSTIFVDFLFGFCALTSIMNGLVTGKIIVFFLVLLKKAFFFFDPLLEFLFA